MNPLNTSVLLIYTGGTIGMIENAATGALENFNFEQLQKYIPELQKFNFQSRLIDADIGRMYCKEVHYELRGRHYFALAFGNTSGGYEVRNAYYKGCLNNKDISLIRHLTEETQENVCVFEGFMDFLSYMTLKLAGDRTVCLAMPCDYLVMNSVNNLKKTLARLQEYSVIHCYLDNDLAGQRTTETIAGMYDGRVSDESCHYAEYKDLNDYLRGKKR